MKRIYFALYAAASVFVVTSSFMLPFLILEAWLTSYSAEARMAISIFFSAPQVLSVEQIWFWLAIVFFFAPTWVFIQTLIFGEKTLNVNSIRCGFRLHPGRVYVIWPYSFLRYVASKSFCAVYPRS